MKRVIAGAVSAIVLLMSGCATFCKLTVTNGTGSGEYAPLQSVAIQANPPATNKAFETWSGDISGIGNATNSSTLISMNQIDKTITAMYKDIIPPTPPAPSKDYTPVAGDRLDKGPEVWNPNFNGMDIRLSANDGKNLVRCGYPCVDGWYPLDHSVSSGIVLSTAPDGGIIASAGDFTSPRTGKRYHFCGFYVHTTDGNVLTPVYTINIPKNQCSQTLRFMFVTMKDNRGWFNW